MRQSPSVWAGCCQEKSFLLHLTTLGRSILPCFSFLASGREVSFLSLVEKARVAWAQQVLLLSILSVFSTKSQGLVRFPHSLFEGELFCLNSFL